MGVGKPHIFWRWYPWARLCCQQNQNLLRSRLVDVQRVQARGNSTNKLSEISAQNLSMHTSCEALQLRALVCACSRRCAVRHQREFARVFAQLFLALSTHHQGRFQSIEVKKK